MTLFARIKHKYIDPKLVFLLAGFYTLFNLLYIAKLAFLRSNYPREIKETWHQIIFDNILIDWLIVVSYMTLIGISTKRLLNKNYSWSKIFFLHTLFSVFIGLVIRLVFDIRGLATGYLKWEDYSFTDSLNRLVMVMDFNFLIYFSMIFIVYTYYYLKQVKETQKQKSLLETQLVNTKMKMLSSQLQPHFLFNTLNSISVLIELDAKKAQNTIADLSDLLREILYSGDEYKVSLKKEMHMLNYYLNILNVRFSDHLKIHKNIDVRLLDRKVPAMIIQPLVENSVKHGYSYHHTELEVNISVFKEKKKMVLKVDNNGQCLSENQVSLLKKGVGLTNIKDRLYTLYGEKASFLIQNKTDDQGVETIIKIPLEF